MGEEKRPTDGRADGLKEAKKPPSWVKANRPPRGKKERKKWVHGFARRREEPAHRMENAAASCPGCATPFAGGKMLERRQVISIPRVRTRVTEHLVLERTCPEVQEEMDLGAGLERHRRGPATDWHLGAKRSKCAQVGVPAPLWGDSALLEVALRTGPEPSQAGEPGPGRSGAGRNTTD